MKISRPWGISISDFNEILAEYAKMNFDKNFKDYYEFAYDTKFEGIARSNDLELQNKYKKVFEKAITKTKKEIYDACQTYEYQSNSISSSSQTPFSTIMFNIPTSLESQWIIESYLKVRMNGLGKRKKIAVFPKINYVAIKELNLEGSKLFPLTKLAAKCISKNFYPDILNYSLEEYKEGKIYSRMG